MLSVLGLSLLNPSTEGVSITTCPGVVVLTSASNPDPGLGSLPSLLLMSLSLEASSQYNLTQASCDTSILNNAYA